MYTHRYYHSPEKNVCPHTYYDFPKKKNDLKEITISFKNAYVITDIILRKKIFLKKNKITNALGVSDLNTKKNNMKSMAQKGYTTATDFADYLVKKKNL